MKRFVATTSLVIGFALLAAACGDDDDTDEPAATDATETTAAGAAAEPTAAGGGAGGDAAACAEGNTLEDGTLTIATGNPAFPPYVIDDAPESGEGFEAAVAMAVARELGFEGDAVTWVRTGFDEAIQPGAKNFDFNLQQFSITDERKQTVDFSDPYYISNQAVVGFADSPAVGATTVADLKGLKFGAQAGTTSLEFITDVIQPDEEPFAYDDNVGAKAALEANQIDAIVVDLPTAFYITAAEIEGTQVIGQFPAEAGGTTDEFGLLFDKDNPLVECANLALAALAESGELDTIEQTWMSDNAGAPVISVG
jgi:polar amino acid transport system substrate-binding protein